MKRGGFGEGQGTGANQGTSLAALSSAYVATP